MSDARAKVSRGSAAPPAPVLDPQKANELVATVALGVGRATAASSVGINNLEQILEADPALRSRLDQAEAKVEVLAVAEARRLANEGDRRAAAWLRERLSSKTNQSSDRQSETDAPQIQPTAITPRTEGQRMFCEIKAPITEIAVRLRTTKQSVSYWRRGEKVPSATARVLIEKTYNISSSSWERAVGGDNDEQPKPELVKRKGTPTTLEEVVTLLEDLRLQRESGGLVASARVRLADSEGKLLALKARLERDRELLEDRIVREHPGFKRVVDVILDATRPFPDAARAIADALKKAI